MKNKRINETLAWQITRQSWYNSGEGIGMSITHEDKMPSLETGQMGSKDSSYLVNRFILWKLGEIESCNRSES